MPWFKGQSYTGFKGVDLKGSTYIRLHGDANGASGTLTFDRTDGADRAWEFPNKSGKFPVSGTILVSLPAVNAGALSETIAVVSGMRTEDGVSVCIQSGQTTITTRGLLVPVMAIPTNGQLSIVFQNVTATATTAQAMVIGYTAVR